MNFEDGFQFNQQQANDRVVWAYLSCINSHVKQKQWVVASNWFIESALKQLSISSFDFLNDASISVVQSALTAGINFLIENGLLSSKIDDKDRFYKYFVKKDLFRSREFSDEFESDLVLNLMYKLKFSFHYIVSENFPKFYKLYLTNCVVLSATKTVRINLPKTASVTVLVLPKHIAKNFVKEAVATYDYASKAQFLGSYDKAHDTVTLFSTKSPEDDEELLNRLTLAINLNSDLKKEFFV